MNNSILQEDLQIIASSDVDFEKFRNTRFMVTGATGLIGVSIVRALLFADEYFDLGLNIVIWVRNTEKAKLIYGDKFSKLNVICSDITQGVQYKNEVDYIFHCASVTASKTMVERPVETITTSLIGTKKILDFAKDRNCKSLLYISSMEMYGRCTEINHDISEQDMGYIDILNVRSNYPESKRMCENMCIAYLAEYGVPVKIARLAQTFGPGILPDENRVFAQFARSVVNHTDIVLHTNGKSEGNYCYLRDSIIGLFIILTKGKNGEAYNVSNPKSHTTIANMAKMVAEKIANKSINVIFDIPKDNTYGYAVETKMKLNSDKLQALGWTPIVDLEEAYRRMVTYLTEIP